MFSAYMPSIEAHTTNPYRDPAPPKRVTPKETHGQGLKQKLIEAHGRAKRDISVFKNSFQQIGNSDERVHAVKVGFPAQGGEYEWMWVSLDDWRGDFLNGSIQNTPVLRKDLQKGGRVRISETEVFDWVIVRGKEVSGRSLHRAGVSLDEYGPRRGSGSVRVPVSGESR